jgi:hypothetical protein
MSKYCKPAAPVNVLDALCADQDILTLEGEFIRHGLRVVAVDEFRRHRPEVGTWRTGTGEPLFAQCPSCIGSNSGTCAVIWPNEQFFNCRNCGLHAGIRPFLEIMDERAEELPLPTAASLCDDRVSLHKSDPARKLMKVLWDRAAPISGPAAQVWLLSLGTERWLAVSMGASLRWFPGSREGLADHEPAVLAQWQNIIDGSWTGLQVISVGKEGRPTGQTTVGEWIGSAIKLGPPLPSEARAAPLVVAPSLRAAALAARVLEEPCAVWVLPTLLAIKHFPVLTNVDRLLIVIRDEDDETVADDIAQRYVNSGRPVELITVSVEGGVR